MTLRCRERVLSTNQKPTKSRSLDSGANIDLGQVVGIAGKAHLIAGQLGLAAERARAADTTWTALPITSAGRPLLAFGSA